MGLQMYVGLLAERVVSYTEVTALAWGPQSLCVLACEPCVRVNVSVTSKQQDRSPFWASSRPWMKQI